MPVPSATVDPCWKGRKIRSSSRRREPGPFVLDGDERLAPGARDPDDHSRFRRRELERVLEQVDEDPLDLIRVGVHEQELRGKRDVDSLLGAQLAERLGEEGVHRAKLPPRRGPHPAWRRERSSRFPTSRSSRSASTRTVSRERVAIVLIEVEGRVREALDADTDGRQRRAQVVAHRPQKRRLHRVAPPQRLGLERLARQPLPLDRDAEQGRERGEKALARERARVDPPA